MVTSAVLAEEWQRALSSWNRAIENDQDKDTRVPTFVILDEAHNFIPAEPRDVSEIVLREQFRTIAAEGRNLRPGYWAHPYEKAMQEPKMSG